MMVVSVDVCDNRSIVLYVNVVLLNGSVTRVEMLISAANNRRLVHAIVSVLTAWCLRRTVTGRIDRNINIIWYWRYRRRRRSWQSLRLIRQRVNRRTTVWSCVTIRHVEISDQIEQALQISLLFH